MYYNPLYIVDLITLEKQQLQAVPEDMEQSPESTWVAIHSPGRNNPFYHYTGGEDTLKFTLDFYAVGQTQQDVLLRAKWFQALGRADAYTGQPHPVKIIWGSIMFQEAIWICNPGKIRWVRFNGEFSMLPSQAYMDVMFKRVTEKNVDLNYIRRITT